MVLFRRLLGDVLRRHRQRQGRTLRDVAASARISLGYLSEIERGRKEASSELLASLCEALNVSLADVLREVSHDIAVLERGPLAPVGFVSTPELAPDLAPTAFAARPVAMLPKVSAALEPHNTAPGTVVAVSRMPVVAA